MIGALFAAFQVAAAPLPQSQTAQSPQSLVIRDATQSVRVAVVASPNGPMLRPDLLAAMVPIVVRHDSGSFYTIEVEGTRLQLESGVAIVRVGGETRPLASPPTVTNGHFLVPLQLISEVFPKVVPNTRWDADSSQLVVFGSTRGGLTPKNAAKQNVGEQPPVSRRSASLATSASVSGGRLPPVPVKHNRRTIVVDAGHGGVDNGMTGPIGGGPRIYEKTITLAVAMKLGEQLEARGVDVVYTRTADTLIALDDRGRIANRANGDLFISIHVNAANPNWKDPGGSRGFETYFLSEARTEDARRVEHMENESIQFEDSSKPSADDPLGFIKADMAQNEHLRESSELADIIQQRLGKMHPGPSRGVKQAGFRVLVTAYMPAVLVEIGFGTNPREAAFLSDPAKQSAIAAAVADAAMTYLRRYEDRTKANGAGAGGGVNR
ncbi:MAG: N-acetylmuramoyl-L-alanine amidase [Gemmatimonadetes bacterium]|nr:N-acetylmuramoyl-L-alanine amidase [Gemmatimonadota bacterium]